MASNFEPNSAASKKASTFRKASSLFKQGRLEDALEEYRTLLDLYPDLSNIVGGWIRILEMQTSSTGHGGSSPLANQIDIIIPVHNAKEYAIECISSIISSSSKYPKNLIIINDCSNDETRAALEHLAFANNQITLVNNQENIGYTRSVNLGLRSSRSHVAIILNSDTVVSDRWLDKIVYHFSIMPELAAVGALSNAASYQSIPRVKDDSGSFAVNPLPDGHSIETVNKLLESSFSRSLAYTPILNGFCYALRRSALERVGYLDEASFPRGYGEENDLFIRLTNHGYKIGVACDTYVFHAKSKSFGQDQKIALSKLGRQALEQKHGKEKVIDCIRLLEESSLLEKVREYVSFSCHSLSQAKSITPDKLRIVFILPVKGGGGGAHSVIQEASHLNRLGIHAKVAIKEEHFDTYVKAYPNLSLGDILLPLKPEIMTERLKDFNVVIATIFQSASLAARIHQEKRDIMPAYYIQDYEPLFFSSNDPQRKIALSSYTASDKFLCFAKTDWICQQVRKHHSVEVFKVKPSLDHAVYKPSFQRDNSLTVSAMIRPKTPRRGAERTMTSLREIKEATGATIEIFGCHKQDPFFENYSFAIEFVNHGPINREQVASILQRSDLFLDLSDYQAFGRTGIEAMACGCIPVLPVAGGAHEYGIDNVNCIFVDVNNIESHLPDVIALLRDADRLVSMRLSAISTASGYSVHAAAISEYILIAKKFQEHIKKYPLEEKYRLDLSIADFESCPQCLLEALIIPNAGRLDISLGSHLFKGWQCGHSHTLFSISHSSLGMPDKECNVFTYETTSIDEHVYMSYPAVKSDKSQSSSDRNTALSLDFNDIFKATSDISQDVRYRRASFDSTFWQANLRDSHNRKYYIGRGGIIRIGFMGCSHDIGSVDACIHRLTAMTPDSLQCQYEAIGVYQGVKTSICERIGLPRNKEFSNFRRWLKERIEWNFGYIYKPGFSHHSSGVDCLSAILYRIQQYSALGIPVLIDRDCVLFDFLDHSINCFVVDQNALDQSLFSDLLASIELQAQMAEAMQRKLLEISANTEKSVVPLVFGES